jgi:hypothetical protein
MPTLTHHRSKVDPSGHLLAAAGDVVCVLIECGISSPVAVEMTFRALRGDDPVSALCELAQWGRMHNRTRGYQ